MARRRARRRRGGGGARVIPVSFAVSVTKSSATLPAQALNIDTSRPIRILRVSANMVGSIENVVPAIIQLSILDAQGQIISTSRARCVGTATTRLSVRLPRMTDYADYAANARLVQINIIDYSGGTPMVVIISGSILVQYSASNIASFRALSVDEVLADEPTMGVRALPDPVDDRTGGVALQSLDSYYDTSYRSNDRTLLQSNVVIIVLFQVIIILSLVLVYLVAS